MAYTKLGWVNDRVPALNQTNLNHMDQGIFDAHQELAEYEEIFTADVDESVQNWLDEHPEATTTVEDGSISKIKLTSSFADEIDAKISCYETLSTMIEDATLSSGRVVKTLGKDSNNDGKGETYYIHEGELFGKDFIVLENGLHASAISRSLNSESFSNDDSAKQWLADCALSWMNHASEIHYSGEKNLFFDDTERVDGYWSMTCSIFAMSMIFGIDFEHSKYNGLSANEQNPNAYHDDDLLEKLRNPAGFYSDDILPYFMTKGYAFEPTSNLSNVQTGDIIFYAQGVAPDNFLGVDHTAIFAYHNNDRVYTVWEVGGDAGPVQSIKRYSSESYNVVMVVRVPFKQCDTKPIVNLFQSSASPNVGVTQITSVLSENLKVNSWYTFIVKATNISQDRAFPALYSGGYSKKLVSYNSQYTKRPFNDVYVMPFYVDVAVSDHLNPSIVGADSSVPTATATFDWECIVEGFYPDIIQFLPYYEPVDDFTSRISSNHTKGLVFSGLRVGRLCNITIDLTMTSNVNAWEVIATIPAGYRPLAQQTTDKIDITTSGNVRTLEGLNSGQNIKWSFSYLTSME